MNALSIAAQVQRAHAHIAREPQPIMAEPSAPMRAWNASQRDAVRRNASKMLRMMRADRSLDTIAKCREACGLTTQRAKSAMKVLLDRREVERVALGVYRPRSAA